MSTFEMNASFHFRVRCCDASNITTKGNDAHFAAAAAGDAVAAVVFLDEVTAKHDIMLKSVTSQLLNLLVARQSNVRSVCSHRK